MSLRKLTMTVNPMPKKNTKIHSLAMLNMPGMIGMPRMHGIGSYLLRIGSEIIGEGTNEYKQM